MQMFNQQRRKCEAWREERAQNSRWRRSITTIEEYHRLNRFMPDDRKYTAFCGLNCKYCIPSNERLFQLMREYRRYTPEEKERISRGACPHCGCERLHFKPGNENTTCCQTSCSMEYWFKVRPTIAEMRRLVRDEQGGKCARCRQEVRDFNGTGSPYNHHHYVLDHVRPIAMGSDQWARDNLQVLCERCNKIKTARDMGRISRWNKYHCRGMVHHADNSRKVMLSQENWRECARVFFQGYGECTGRYSGNISFRE